ncbi:hypothetical protein ZWY2020_010704 [Hordeum vulgare]|nr:hypothetical protein ZWY2020_010704 [Hordeum vulgare]
MASRSYRFTASCATGQAPHRACASHTSVPPRPATRAASPPASPHLGRHHYVVLASPRAAGLRLLPPPMSSVLPSRHPPRSSRLSQVATIGLPVCSFLHLLAPTSTLLHPRA